MFDSDFWERQERKRKIRAEINKLQREINEAREQISEFNDCKEYISDAVDNWNNQYSSFQAITLAPVKVELEFEGYSADRITEKLLPVIEDINKSSSLSRRVFPGIADQIEKLNDFIKEKQKLIDALNEEYDSLG